MHRIIAGGTGLIGKRLVEHWLRQKHSIMVVGRTEAHIREIFADRVTAVTWDQLSAEHLKQAELVVNLTGENVGGGRWSKKRKQEMLRSRLDSIKTFVNLISQLENAPLRLLNASGVGIYGLQPSVNKELPPPLDEDTKINWEHPKDFLSLIARRCEKAAKSLEDKGTKVIFLRFGAVLAKEGGALPQLIKAYQFYMGGILGSGRQPFSWVAIDDVIRAIDFLVAHSDLTGPFNIVAPECVSQAIFSEVLASVLSRPQFLRIPAFLLKFMLGEMAQTLLLNGQHAYPKRLLENGFKFSYPDLESALNHELRGK